MQGHEERYDMGLEWRKIEQDMKKVGLKNGLSDGRDSNFQPSFDKGYEDGFRNSFLLGKLKFTNDLCQNPSPLLQNIEMGMCVVCEEEKENNTVANVREKQTNKIEANIQRISTERN